MPLAEKIEGEEAPRVTAEVIRNYVRKAQGEVSHFIAHGTDLERDAEKEGSDNPLQPGNVGRVSQVRDLDVLLREATERRARFRDALDAEASLSEEEERQVVPALQTLDELIEDIEEEKRRISAELT